MSLNKKLMDLYNKETACQATYQKDGVTFHTLKYVDWLEDYVSKFSGVDTAQGFSPARGCNAQQHSVDKTQYAGGRNKKRYTYESLYFNGGNGFMIFDNVNDPEHKKGLCFATREIGVVCDALNFKEVAKRSAKKRVETRKQAVQLQIVIDDLRNISRIVGKFGVCSGSNCHMRLNRNIRRLAILQNGK
jgi:hypothetical protein